MHVRSRYSPSALRTCIAAHLSPMNILFALEGGQWHALQGAETHVYGNEQLPVCVHLPARVPLSASSAYSNPIHCPFDSRTLACARHLCVSARDAVYLPSCLALSLCLRQDAHLQHLAYSPTHLTIIRESRLEVNCIRSCFMFRSMHLSQRIEKVAQKRPSRS